MTSEPSRAPFDLERWRSLFRELKESLERELEREKLPAGGLIVRRFAELQFRGQVHALRVPIEDADLAAADGGEAVIERFSEMYESKFGRGSAYREAGVEASTFVVEGVAKLPHPLPEALPDEGADPAAAAIGERAAFLAEHDGGVPVPVYSAERLRPGNEVAGPAIAEAEDTTVLVHPGQRLWVDGLLNLRIELGG